MKNTNILFKCLMLLVLATGWGNIFAQTSQLPLSSGVYEILNTSNEGGTGTGRGYLVSYTGHSTGIGLAEVTWTSHSGKHPNQRNSAQTCSYWYLHNHGDGTYTLVSISTLGDNTVPRFLTVGSNGGKSSIAATPETRLVFKDSGTSSHNRNGVRAVNIANQAASNVYLSGGCGTYSSSGSVMATTTASDGGCPWLFLPVTTSLEPGQQAILDKYLERFAHLSDGITLAFQDGSGNPLTGDQVVIYTPTSGPEVELTPALGTYDFGDIPYSPGLFSLRDNSKVLDVSYDEAHHTLTFTITTDPNVLVTSSAPVDGAWAAGTKWFTIHNNRNAKGYLSTQDAGQYLDANATLTIKNGADARSNRGGLWAFVEKDGGFNIYNNAYGPDFILGISGSGGGARLQMYPKDAVPGGVSTLFAYGENSTRDGGASHAYYFNIGLTGNNHLNEQSGYAGTWNPGGTQKTTDGGSAFTVTAIEQSAIDALPTYDVYKAQWRGASVSDFDINYNHSGNVFGRRGSVANGSYFIVNHDSPVALGDFTTTVSTEYTLGSVTVKDAPTHTYRILDFFIKDAKATDEWTVNVNGGYTVTYVGDEYNDGATFFLRPGVTPKALDFTINAATDKFVWGPIFNTQAKTVTYDVRERATTFTSGWYQMQLTDDCITGLPAKIKNEEGNINTVANTLYLAPAIYEPGNNRYFKLTGVPQYAGETATFVYVRDNISNYTFVNPSTGAETSANGFTFTDGRLDKATGWSFESSAHPLEGPYLLTSGSQTMAFNITPAPIENYDIYKVNIVGSGVTADMRLNINNHSVVGNTLVANESYIFLQKGAAVPLRPQFSVKAGNFTVEALSVGEKTDGVTPLTITVTPRQTLWTVHIIGEAKQLEDRVVYNNLNYNDGDMVGVPFGTTPTALNFKTNVTDRFVWGPIFNENLQTVTFEVRNTATEFTEGKWYQMVLRDKAGQVYNGGVKSSDSMVDAINAMAHLRHKSNYIYPITSNATDWPFELTGITGEEMRANTYIYVKRVSGNNITLMMQNGMHLNQNGQGYGSDANSVPLVYQPATKTFRWDAKALPWENLRNNVGVGNTGAANNGNMEYFVTQAPIKAYKVAITSGSGTLVYNGDTEIIGSKRTANNGFFFANEGTFLEGEDISNIDINKFELRGIEGTISSITASTSNGITTLTVNTTTPIYGKEIIHRQAYYYDELETDENAPGEGFIKMGEGMSSREGTSGTIKEQNMAVYEIPVYLKQGTSFTSYMPTDQVKRYQRWYNWDDDGQVDPTVLTSLPGWSVSAANTYDNGHLTGTGYGGFRGNPTLSLPTTMTKYNVGLDMAHYPTRGNIGSGLVEPTLAMRIVYQVRDAKIIAKDIKDKTAAGKFYEVHDIAFPNIKHGNLEDKTIGNLMPLDMDLNNYWIFDGDGETNADLVQLLQSGGAQLEVELGAHSAGAELTNVRMINGTANAESGNIRFSSFNTGHFVLFQYPNGGIVPAGSTATINVYIRKGSGKRYNLAQFNVSFIGNSEPIAVTELPGSHRHPDALAEAFGAPVAELTFDNKTNNEFGSFYKYPLDYKGVSYAFGTMVSGGGHTGWFASRGEYGLGSEYQTSKALGGGNYKYYPVNNYLRNMSNVNASFSAKEQDSYCLYIDAADQPGKVASIQLEDALCAGSRLYCYGYIGCTSGGTDQNPTSVLINVMGINKLTGKEELIYSYCPGIITLRAYDKDNRRIYAAALGRGTVYEPHGDDANYWAPWQQIGFSFAISADIASKMSSYSVQIVNNAWNSDGADTMLDDFEIYVKKPGAEVQNTTPLCSDQIRHIKVITEYNTLIEATGEDTNHDGLMNVGFCFLDKEIYDKVLADNANKDADHGYPRNSSENKYNMAFGEALMGVRTLDSSNKDHAFHNFDIIRDGTVSTIKGETKQRFYTDIPQYSFKESGDDVVYRDSIRGERYIVFKESVAHGEPSSLTAHKWTAGKSYYLLFSTAAISQEHVTQHDLGCTVFNLDDNRCSVMYEFTVAPPVSIKGDVEEIISGDEVQACTGQTSTLTVNLNGRTDTHDVVLKNLNYDWWIGYVSHKQMEMENGVPKYYDGDGHAIVIPGAPDVTHNTLPATMQNYMNVWWGTYSADHTHLDKHAGDRIYLSDAMVEFRRAYPDATDLTGVVPKHVIGDTEEYELTQDMINCIAHFLQVEPESGLTPLILSKKEMNLTMTIDKADDEQVYHFVVIPIAPGIYAVDEDAIYCPDPQELKVKLLNAAPTLYNGFDNMTYPTTMENVPVRVGLKQIEAVRQVTSGPQRTLTVPVRNAGFAYPEGQFLVKSGDAEIYLVGTNDPAYKLQENVTTSILDNATLGNIDSEDMFLSAGRVETLAVKRGASNPTMQLTFNHNVIFREGYTYTLKVKYFEVKNDNERDMACEGSFVFDLKVVPEYQVWTAADGNSDWTNDRNWRRADREELHAGGEATGNGMTGATALNDATSYASNTTNTTDGSFVPMYFTNVLFKRNSAEGVELYKNGSFKRPLLGTRFLEGLDATATPAIVYDMAVTPVNPADRTAFNYDCSYECELFDTYVANGVTFEPGTQMGNAHYLTYNKAWVECELDADRWYTIASPLKKSVAGDWYSPTNGGKQLTPHFYDINYREDLNDRFRPAYFQRSWDRDGNNIVYTKTGGKYDSYVRADWSNVYNDATVNYNKGGFSVKAELDYMDPADRPADGKVLVRLPKADTSYTYYDVEGSTGQAADALIGARNESYRLLSDDLGADGAGSIAMNVSNETSDNNFLLLSNPFMAAMDMDKFFAANTDLEEKYWIVSADRQMVSVKSADNGEWITTGDADGKYVAPLQGFFVKKKDAAPNPGSINASYSAAMQTVVNPDPVNPGVVFRAPASRAAIELSDMIRLTAERNGAKSTALIVLSENAHDGYVVGEDCETFLDGNLETKPNVYTVAAATAQSINVRKTLDMVPVGIISTDDSPAILRFDLSDSSHTILYLYDAETESYTTVNDGTEVTMPGNNAGRYFIVSDIRTILDDDATEVSEAVDLYNLHGIRVATSLRGTVTIRGSRKEFNR